MRKFKATTQHGTSYVCNEPGLVRIYSADGVHMQTIKGRIASFPPEMMEKWEMDGALDWDYLRNAPSVEVPIVGEHIYLDGFKEWRISTPVVTLEECK